MTSRIHSISRSQHSLVTREQLRSIGLSRYTISAAVRRGELEEFGRAVFRLGGASETVLQRALAVVLDAESAAAVSHASAAAFWEVAGFRLEPVNVTAKRVAHPARLHRGRIHRPMFDIEPHIVELDGLPVLSPIATVWSLAASGHVHPGKVERTLDAFWARRLVTGRILANSIDQFARRGRAGSRMMREFAEARPPEYVAPESGLESRFVDLCRRYAVGGFVRQREVGGETEWLGRVDFVDRERGLIVQIDGDRFHTALLDVDHDRRQTARLEATGWQVLRFNERHLWQDDEEMFAAIRAAPRGGAADAA